MKSIAVVGAGIAGLSAGCYAQMNGYQAQIYETHTKPGGLCTAWQRKGYTFDGCVHHLGEMAKGYAKDAAAREEQLAIVHGWQEEVEALAGVLEGE